MKKIIVTPAGREEYLSILLKYLTIYKNFGEFDEWHLWCNTDKESDIEYMHRIAEENDFIKLLELGEYYSDVAGNKVKGFVELNDGHRYYACTIPYFIGQDSADINSVYLRLDDDIVFIAKDSIKNIFEYRISNKENFIIYGNIVNNPVLSHIHQNIGALSTDEGHVSFSGFDTLGLYNGNFVHTTHKNFFDKYYKNELDKYYFEPIILSDYTHVSIQVISWHGSEFAKFDGKIPDMTHEENYVSFIRPQEIQMPNAIFGKGLFCHYSAAVTRKFIDTTDVLHQYRLIADDYLKTMPSLPY